MVDRVWMVSTITPASACRDLLEIAVRLVRLANVIKNRYICLLISAFFFIFIFFCLTLRVLYIKDKMNIMV